MGSISQWYAIGDTDNPNRHGDDPANVFRMSAGGSNSGGTGVVSTNPDYVFTCGDQVRDTVSGSGEGRGVSLFYGDGQDGPLALVDYYQFVQTQDGVMRINGDFVAYLRVIGTSLAYLEVVQVTEEGIVQLYYVDFLAEQNAIVLAAVGGASLGLVGIYEFDIVLFNDGSCTTLVYLSNLRNPTNYVWPVFVAIHRTPSGTIAHYGVKSLPSLLTSVGLVHTFPTPPLGSEVRATFIQFIGAPFSDGNAVFSMWLAGSKDGTSNAGDPSYGILGMFQYHAGAFFFYPLHTGTFTRGSGSVSGGGAINISPNTRPVIDDFWTGAEDIFLDVSIGGSGTQFGPIEDVAGVNYDGSHELMPLDPNGERMYYLRGHNDLVFVQEYTHSLDPGVDTWWEFWSGFLNLGASSYEETNTMLLGLLEVSDWSETPYTDMDDLGIQTFGDIVPTEPSLDISGVKIWEWDAPRPSEVSASSAIQFPLSESVSFTDSEIMLSRAERWAVASLSDYSIVSGFFGDEEVLLIRHMMEIDTIPWLRQRQRDDLRVKGGRVQPTSRQNSIRQGRRNTYL